MGRNFQLARKMENGRFLPVLGSISKEGMDPRTIASGTRYVFEGGQYSITVGVPTVNGVLYEAITQDVEVEDRGSTKIKVELQRPPTVRTQFIENGEEIPGTNATVYQDEVEVFGLRPGEDYFVMPGE